MDFEKCKPLVLMTNEELVYDEHNTCWNQYYGFVDGHLFVTNFRIVFGLNMNQNKQETSEVTQKEDEAKNFFFTVPICLVEKVSKQNTKKQGKTAYILEIQCRDFQNIKVVFDSDNETLKKLQSLIHKFAFPISNNLKLPAFLNKEEFKFDGWDVYNPLTEYARMGIPNDLWRMCSLNESYDCCSTYPSIFAVPKNITDVDITDVKEFRSRNRIPVLSWVHPSNQCTITRCSQPLTGATKRSKDDEKYVQGILEASPSCHKLVIFDARPKLNAVANQAMGGGYEAIKNYNSATIIFLDIANIHVMRESYSKLRMLCFFLFDDDHWYSSLESTKWLEHVSKILVGAVKIAETVYRNRTSVIVHCSDGWDRTSQLTSLAMICLDPYFRTILGFQVLIEKEWCSFGHKFAQRHGFGVSNVQDEQRSPVFAQFVDCVWQIMQQYPCAFEFTERMLILILDLMYSCWYGTFLCDSQNERDSMNVKTTTPSIWSAINSNINGVLNPLYCPERFQPVILPVPSVPHVRLWKSYYFRWNPLMKPKTNHEAVYKILTEKHAKCLNRLEKLKAELAARTASKMKNLDTQTQ